MTDSIQRQFQQTKLTYDKKVNQLATEKAAMKAKFKSLLGKNASTERDDQNMSEPVGKLHEKSVKIDELERINAKLLATLNLRSRDCLSHGTGRTIELVGGRVYGESESEDQDQFYVSGTLMRENEKLDQYLSRIERELTDKILENHELGRSLAASENKIWDLEVKLTETSHRQQHRTLETRAGNSCHDLCCCKNSDHKAEHELDTQKQALKDEIEVIQSQNNKLETQIRSLFKSTFSTQDCGRGDEILPKELENQIEYLQERIISLLSKNSHLSKTSIELRGLVGDLKERGGDLRKTSEELTIVCEKLKTDLVQSEKKVHSLEDENFSLSEMIIRLNKNIAELKATCHPELIQSKEEAPHRDVIEQLNSVNAERDKLEDEVTRLKEKEEDLDFTLKELQGEIDAHQSKEEDLKAKVVDSENYILQVTEELDKLQRRVGESDASAKNLKKEKDQLNEELKKVTQTSNKKSTKITALQRENFELINQLSRLTNEMSNTHRFKTEVKLYEEQNAFLRRDLIEKTDSMQTFSKEIDRLKQLVESQKQEKKELHEDILVRDEQITQLEEKVLEFRLSQEQNEDTIQDLQQMLDETVAEYKSYSKDQKQAIESIEQRIDILDEEKATLETTNKVLLEKVIKLKDSLRKAQSIHAEMLARLNNAKKNTVRQSDLVNLQLRYVAVCTEKEKFEDTCKQLFKRIDMLTVQMKNLQESAELMEQCNASSRSEIESLRKAFRQNRKQNDELQRKLEFMPS